MHPDPKVWKFMVEIERAREALSTAWSLRNAHDDLRPFANDVDKAFAIINDVDMLLVDILPEED